ncbi:unnamed protein product [Musa textilis]
MEEVTEGHHFVLVHGAGHGAWCWFKLRCLLEASGHRVSCPDLASAGIHPADPNSILSIDEYDAPLFGLMSALPEHEKVIMVGHSAGGLSVTHALHVFSNKIKVAIFVAATMLPWGYQTEEDIKDGVPDLSRFGDVYELKYSMGPNNPPTSVALRKEFQRKILYQLNPIEDSTLASMLLRPWPATLPSTRFHKDKVDGLKHARRVYIKTTHDNMVNPQQQDAMIRRWPPDDVLVMETDHSPFFSAPMELFKLVMKASTCAHDVP